MWSDSELRLHSYLVPFVRNNAFIFGPLCIENCNHIWSKWLKLLQSHLVQPYYLKILSKHRSFNWSVQWFRALFSEFYVEYPGRVYNLILLILYKGKLTLCINSVKVHRRKPPRSRYNWNDSATICQICTRSSWISLKRFAHT